MSTPAFTQDETSPWPGGYGEPIAIVRIRPPLFSRAFGLTFVTRSDDRGDYHAAAIRLRSGRMLRLLRRADAPENAGTEIHADASDDFVRALRELFDAFDLSVEDLSWMRADIPAQELR